MTAHKLGVLVRVHVLGADQRKADSGNENGVANGYKNVPSLRLRIIGYWLRSRSLVLTERILASREENV